MRAIIWMGEPLPDGLLEQAGMESVIVRSLPAFLSAPRDTRTVAFVDATTLAQLDQMKAPEGAVMAVADGPLPTAVQWVASYHWLGHVVGRPMLQLATGPEYLRNVVATLTKGDRPRLLDWLTPRFAGRRVRIVQASRRVERLERMAEFLDARDVDATRVQLACAAAEELLTNVFYRAPLAAGVVSIPIARSQDVALPEDKACDVVYGVDNGVVLVRVRDPFGALMRPRVVETLSRCARGTASVTHGAPGAGLWRIFSTATFVAISVIDNRHTEVLVGFAPAVAGPRPYAFDLFFRQTGRPVRRWKLLSSDTDQPITDQSITILTK